MNHKKPIVALILFGSVTLLISSVFASSDNWVEVTKFEGKGLLMGKSESFEVNHFEWRIKYNYTYPFEFGNIPLVFYLTSNETYIIIGNTTSFGEPILTFHPEENNGTYNIEGHLGVFYLHFSPTYVDSYSFIIEQNIESIPEFPSLSILVSGVSVITLISIIYKQKRKWENQK